MTSKEKKEYYTERIECCNRLIKDPRSNSVRIRNNKKKWEYKLKILERDELV